MENVVDKLLTCLLTHIFLFKFCLLTEGVTLITCSLLNIFCVQLLLLKFDLVIMLHFRRAGHVHQFSLISLGRNFFYYDDLDGKKSLDLNWRKMGVYYML